MTDPEQPLRAIAYLVGCVRPDWDTPGTMAALRRRQDAPVGDLAIAALYAAITRSDQRTPAVIALDGPHWRIQPVEPDHAPARVDYGPRCWICGLDRDLHTSRVALCADHEWIDPRTAPARCARCGVLRDHHTGADHPWTSCADLAQLRAQQRTTGAAA